MKFIGSNIYRRAAFLVAIFMATTVFAYLNIAPGYAHDPIFIENTQISAEEGPYLPDGNISFALYGTFEKTSDSRGFRSKLQAGDELVLSLLIPNLAPENMLNLQQLPSLEIERPDTSSIELKPKKGKVFDEPFTGTSYLRLLSIQELAQPGIYHITINGNHPGRFTVSIGTIEQFGTPVENVIDRASNLSRISDWYSDSFDQETNQLAHDGTRFKYRLIVIFGFAGLAALFAVILIKRNIAKYI